MRTDAPIAAHLTFGIAAAVLVATSAPPNARADAPASSPEAPTTNAQDADVSEDDDDGASIRSPRTVTAGLEMSLVGLSFGQRAEFLWRMGGPGSVSHLRLHAGALAGPELVFVPMGIGYRALFREDMTVQPFVGLGYEAHFFLTDGPVYSQLASIYAELGCAFAIDDRFSVGPALSLDWTFAGERGPGLQTRLFTGLRF